ncbi:MAG: DUF1566 domain-containing protein [Bacteroidota bacterium]
MKIKFIFLISAFIIASGTSRLFAQGAAFNNTGAPADPSSMLDVTGSNKGVLIPRVALADSLDATTIPLPAQSLLVYNTNTVNGLVPGYYYNRGTTTSPKWTQLLPNPASVDLNMNGHKVVNVATCTNNPDAANKAYVDAQIALVGGSSPSCCMPSMISDESSSTMNLRMACEYCRTLTEGGFTDWHLPTFHELMYVLSSSSATIANDVSPNYIWIGDYDTQYGTYIYQMRFSDGDIIRMYATSNGRTRCVR